MSEVLNLPQRARSTRWNSQIETIHVQLRYSSRPKNRVSVPEMPASYWFTQTPLSVFVFAHLIIIGRSVVPELHG